MAENIQIIETSLGGSDGLSDKPAVAISASIDELDGVSRLGDVDVDAIPIALVVVAYPVAVLDGISEAALGAAVLAGLKGS